MQEIDAMRVLASALDPLPEESRDRVLAWAASLYGIRIPGAGSGKRHQAPSQTDNTDTPGTEDATFDTLAELFDGSDPQTESEKALVGGYWLQKHEGMSTFDSASVNRELKHLGHAVANITSAFDDLKEQKPALAVQTAKSGKTKQARKKYMITKAGEKYVERMISGEQDETE